MPEVRQGDGADRGGRRRRRRRRPRRSRATARRHPAHRRPLRTAGGHRWPGAGRDSLSGTGGGRRARIRTGQCWQCRQCRSCAATALRGRLRNPGHGPLAGSGAQAGRGARRHRRARLSVLLPHRRGRRLPDQGAGRAVRRPRIRRGQPGQLPARHLRRRSAPVRPVDAALPVPAAHRPARHRHRRRVGPPHGDLRGDPGTVRRGSLHLRVDDGHLPGTARHSRCRSGAGPAAR